MNTIVGNRHDILILFDVTQGNPNGDPDAGNMPRIEPNSNRGIVSDVCLKRKIRNYVELVKPERNTYQHQGKNYEQGYAILVRQGVILNNEIRNGCLEAEKIDPKADDNQKAEAAMKWLCREFYDVRTFGAVLSTGEDCMKGSAFGQVRGPVQFTFAQSFHPITPLEITVTRCAVTKDRNKERTMGYKHIVPYALYAAKCYISPPFAERTGFTTRDLDLFFEALNEMFTHDRSAARGEMVVRGIYDFEHVGSQHPNNIEQNRKEARLGCYHAHRLFDGIKVSLKDGKSFPESFADYDVVNTWTEDNMPKGVVLHQRHELPCKTVRFRL
ncbi:MAG: type I-C CRISPR-associated protein Cas7/Csd2 [Dissulfurimicrobium sp.]|uniref:type I-C CRISPR-associated protein Cas7/Csd2 n=1 Tax=Dissulfurimicrobium sp. TaxID=2022436 RepID=UPI004049BEC0